MFSLRGLRLGAGDQHREELLVSLPAIILGGMRYEPSPGPVVVSLTVTRLRTGWVFDERFSCNVTGPCHRCLGDAVADASVDVREYHSLEKSPPPEPDEVCDYLHGDELDVAAMAGDGLIGALPFSIVCRPDCAGLCPHCGADLNAGPCGCKPDAPDSALSRLAELLDPDGAGEAGAGSAGSR